MARGFSTARLNFYNSYLLGSLLFNLFWESHYYFTNRLGVATFILLVFDIELHNLGADEFPRVPQLLEVLCPIVGTRTRFHPNKTGNSCATVSRSLLRGTRFCTTTFPSLSTPWK